MGPRGEEGPLHERVVPFFSQTTFRSKGCINRELTGVMCVRDAQAWVWRQAAGGRGWRGEAAGGGLGEGRLDGAAGLRWYARAGGGGGAPRTLASFRRPPAL